MWVCVGVCVCLCRCAWWLGGGGLNASSTLTHMRCFPLPFRLALNPNPPLPLPLPLPNHPSPSPQPPVSSAHSVPMKVVEKGDHYILEVAATVKSVMEEWTQSVTNGDILGLAKGDTNKHIVAWQSKVGTVGALTDKSTEEPLTRRSLYKYASTQRVHNVKVHWKRPH